MKKEEDIVKRIDSKLTSVEETVAEVSSALDTQKEESERIAKTSSFTEEKPFSVSEKDGVKYLYIPSDGVRLYGVQIAVRNADAFGKVRVGDGIWWMLIIKSAGDFTDIDDSNAQTYTYAYVIEESEIERFVRRREVLFAYRVCSIDGDVVKRYTTNAVDIIEGVTSLDAAGAETSPFQVCRVTMVSEGSHYISYRIFLPPFRTLEFRHYCCTFSGTIGEWYYIVPPDKPGPTSYWVWINKSNVTRAHIGTEEKMKRTKSSKIAAKFPVAEITFA